MATIWVVYHMVEKEGGPVKEVDRQFTNQQEALDYARTRPGRLVEGLRASGAISKKLEQ